MPDLDSGVHTFALEGPLLTSARVAELTRALSGARAEAAIVLDCQQLLGVSPDGLAALHELAASQPEGRPMALAGLTRTLTRIALEAGLAERFAIYASTAAFERARAREQGLDHAELQRCAL